MSMRAMQLIKKSRTKKEEKEGQPPSCVLSGHHSPCALHFSFHDRLMLLVALGFVCRLHFCLRSKRQINRATAASRRCSTVPTNVKRCGETCLFKCGISRTIHIIMRQPSPALTTTWNDRRHRQKSLGRTKTLFLSELKPNSLTLLHSESLSHSCAWTPMRVSVVLHEGRLIDCHEIIGSLQIVRTKHI